MYQYSLEWFVGLFHIAVDKSNEALAARAKEDEGGSKAGPEEVVRSLNATFTRVLYENVCRSLFETHKLLFSFLLCTKVALADRVSPLDGAELRFLLQGSLSQETERANPTAELSRQWLTDKAWSDLCALSALPAFGPRILDMVRSRTAEFEAVFDDPDPGAKLKALLSDWMPLERPSSARSSRGGAGGAAGSDAPPTTARGAPGGGGGGRGGRGGGAAAGGGEPDEPARSPGLTTWETLLWLRCLRPDKIVPAIREYVSETLGPSFIDPPPFDLKACFADSTPVTPLIFVLSSGADPMSELQGLAEREGKLKTMKQVSLGQGQGPTAEEMVREGVDTGLWVCLQNCHLADSWMPTLERLVEELRPETTADSFRLWLTSMPSPTFPVPVLQNGVKITLEPPQGLRASLLGSYNRLAAEPAWFESAPNGKAFRKLLFGLCFFHAIVRERRRFGPLGWNIPYEFSEPDLQISQQQLAIFLDTPDSSIPYDALRYLVGECNYGGRVTDDKDRRLLTEILSDFYVPDILSDRYKFSPSGRYFAPKYGAIESYLEYVKELPYSEDPEVFGLHANADITCAIQEATALLSTALQLQPRSAGGGGQSWEEELAELAAATEKRLPGLFDIERVEVMFPIRFEESMNTVLTQELLRFNRLLGVVRRSLADVQMAIRGLVVMSGELERMGGDMVQGRVPSMWQAVSYPSLKPLGSWVSDLLKRLAFLQGWIDAGSKPSVFWISGFFFTQSFLTGTRQNYARRYRIPIDELAYDFRVLGLEEGESLTSPPKDGAYISGLFLEGARWDDASRTLRDSEPKVLYQSMPIIHMQPKKEADIPDDHVYHCPVYKTSERRGQLSTTGHSTNFVMMCFLPMDAAQTQKDWIKAGVAMLTQLDD